MTVDIEEPADFVNDLSRGWIMAGNVLVRSLRHNESGFAAVNARFDAVDRRLDRMQESTDARFAGVDARFDAIDERLDRMDARFETLERRVDDMQGQLNRFEVASEARFNRIDAAMEDLKVLVSAAIQRHDGTGPQRPAR